MTARPEIKFRFHNPNSVKETADYIARILVEVEGAKIQRLMREATDLQQYRKNH